MTRKTNAVLCSAINEFTYLYRSEMALDIYGQARTKSFKYNLAKDFCASLTYGVWNRTPAKVDKLTSRDVNVAKCVCGCCE